MVVPIDPAIHAEIEALSRETNRTLADVVNLLLQYAIAKDVEVAERIATAARIAEREEFEALKASPRCVLCTAVAPLNFTCHRKGCPGEFIVLDESEVRATIAALEGDELQDDCTRRVSAN